MCEQQKDERNNRPSQVVFFSNLPWEAEKKMELLTIAKRFGTVEKHLFLKEEVNTESDSKFNTLLASMTQATSSMLLLSRPLLIYVYI